MAAARSRCSPPKNSPPAAIAEGVISSTTRRRSCSSRTRSTCPTRSSRSTRAVTEAEESSTADPSAPAVIGRPARAASMIATKARTSVRPSPCSPANRCPTASSSTVSRRSISASSARSSCTTPPPHWPAVCPTRYYLDHRDCRPSRNPMARRTLRWLLPALVVLLWLGLGGPLGSFNGKLSAVQENDNAAFLPDSAESTQVTELLRGFDTERSLPVILLWESDGGTLDRTAVDGRLADATGLADRAGALAGQASPAIPAEDGAAVEAVLPLRPDLGDALPDLVAELRALPDVAGATYYVTGPAGLFSDFASGFSGIDGLLLLAAFGIVLLILVAVYRSPVLPLLVIGTAGLALSASAAVAYFLAARGWITVNGQSQGIASILVVGAATDYGLLPVSRFREELRLEESRFTAMRIALRRSWEPIVASGATVILGVLCLLFSDLSSNRGLGPISAVSILLAMVAALTFLPAALVLLGRAAFWPFRPRFGDERESGRGWRRVADAVGRRPGAVLAGSLAVLAVAAAFAPTFDARGISVTDAIRGGSEATVGQEALARHFAAGSASPAVVLTPEDGWPQVAAAAAV